MILLDTSAAIQLLRGDLQPQSLSGEPVGISSIVEMELITGIFHGGGRRAEQRIQSFREEVEIFGFGSPAANAAAKIRAELWSRGAPIGDYDVLIAGHALSLRMRLLTANMKHFERVPGLQAMPWSE